MPGIEDKIRTLPLALQAEVEDFVTFLMQRQDKGRHPGKPALKWAGALGDMEPRRSSVELQHALHVTPPSHFDEDR